MDIFWTLIIMLLCLLVEGFFSGSEIGVVSANQMRLRHEAAKGSKGASLALHMLKKPEWLLSTTLVGTNVAVVTNTTVATALAINLFGEKNSWVAIFIVAPLIWIFGEIVPKSIFQARADTVTPKIIFVLRFASSVLFPVLYVFTTITNSFARLFGRQDQNPFTLREEILTMLRMPAEGGDIQPGEKAMVRRIFDFSETTAKEVMIPFLDVTAIEQDSTCNDALVIATSSSHIRLPVYKERVDKIVGVLNVLDLFGVESIQPIKPYIKPVRFVPESKNIPEILLDFSKESKVMAVVVDEYGAAVGLITIEDIMEEVVEEIEDEYDSKESAPKRMRRISNNEYLFSARTKIDALEKELGVQLPKGRYTTLAGLILERSGEIPAPGTIVKIKGISYTIEHSTPQAIQEVRVQI